MSIKSVTKTTVTTYVGISNVEGVSCYASASLQCLFSVNVFRNAVQQCEAPPSSVASAIKDAFVDLSSRKANSKNTSQIRFTVANATQQKRFLDRKQQDASEFLGTLLEYLHDTQANLVECFSFGTERINRCPKCFHERLLATCNRLVILNIPSK